MLKKVGVTDDLREQIGVKFTRVLEHFFCHAFACLFIFGTYRDYCVTYYCRVTCAC